MMEEMEMIVFDIINNGGSAKGLAYEALEAAENGDYEKSEQLLQEADTYLLEAHKIQTKLIQKEVNGNKQEVSILFVHAQDHLMNAIEAKSLLEKMIKIYKRLDNYKKC